MTTEEYTAEMLKALDWLKRLPDEKMMLSALTLMFLKGRNATDEASAIPDAELQHFGEHVQETFASVGFLLLMARGSVVANFTDGVPKYSVSDQGIKEADSLSQ